MAKSVLEVFGKVKGTDKVNDLITGKGSFSKQGFSDAVSAMVNDTTFKITTYGKDGKPNGQVNLSELIRNDIKKTVEKAGYPQKSEADVLNTAEIATKGLAEAVPHMVMEYMKMGKKFDLPQQPKVGGSIYLADVKGKEKTSKIRDIKTKQDLGTVNIKTQDSVQIRAKSPVPAYLQTKVRKDSSGKVVNS